MIEVLSPCKINLFLYITGKRPDGYHNLQTLFALLEHGDSMRFDEHYCNELSLSGNFNCKLEDNLIYKAYDLLKSYTKQDFGVKIDVTKRIPQGGGLGGGSSNAASTLLVLNKMFKLNLSLDELLKLGLKLGADVPVFVNGHSAFAAGVGEQLQNINLKEQYFLVVTPSVHVSTAAIFQDQNLKRDTKVRTLSELMNSEFSNDMQEIVVKKYDKVGHTLTRLIKYGHAQMSGSGSSCFVAFDSLKAAQQACDELELTDCAVFIAKSINTSTVYSALNEYF